MEEGNGGGKEAANSRSLSDIQNISIDATPVQESLKETRRIIERQIDLSEKGDEDALKIIRLNLVFIGGIATVTYSAEALVSDALVYIATGVFFISVSLIVAAYMYSGTSQYGGFGDSPNLDAETVVGLERGSEYDSILDAMDRVDEQLPTNREFRVALLLDHQKGIHHNNVEIKYSAEALRRSSILIYIGVLVISIGFGIQLSPNSPQLLLDGFVGLTVLLALWGLHTVLTALSMVCSHIDRLDDEERFDYDHYGYDYNETLPVKTSKLYLRFYRAYRSVLFRN